MTSDRRVRANRTNARASTGPKTAAGKARSARNSLRHGFNIPVTADGPLAPEMEALAQRIAGEGVDGAALDCARRIAEAQFDLQRVRALRLRLSGGALAALGSTSTLKPQKSLEDLFAIWKGVSALDRYERRALSRRKFAIRDFDKAGGRPLVAQSRLR